MKAQNRLVMALLSIGVLFWAVGAAVAMPPYPGLLDSLKANGSDMSHVLQSCPFAKLQQQGGVPAYAGEPIHLNPAAPISENILCVLVEFSDKPMQVNPGFFDTLLFENQPGCVRHYYNEVTYGSFDVVTVNLPSDLGWQTAPQTYAYYCNGNNGMGAYPQNSQKLVEDIVDAIDSLVDFAVYDNNSDGYVDGLMIVHTGPGAELTGSANDIWSHKWGITPRLKDGVFISTYAIEPEYWLNPGDMTLGVFAHEMGHAFFDLPDLYDVDYSSNGIGKWSLMAGGSWNGSLGNSPAHFDAWSKVTAGICSATNVTSNISGQSIPDVETNDTGAIFRLWTNGSAGDEYFLIENREKTGYDSGLPGQGLLIWHIDEAQTTVDNTDNANEWYPGHTASGHYRVALEQADGLYELEKKLDQGDGADPYPGSTSNTSFNALSSPSSNDYNDQETLVGVTNVSAPGATMTADLSVSLLADVDDYGYSATLPESYDLKQNYPNPFNPTTRITFDLPHSGHVNLSVFNVLGEQVDQLIDNDLPAGRHSISWVSESHGGALPSGVYFYKLSTRDITLTKKMLLLK